MRKSIIRRLRKIEQQTFLPRWRVVTLDYGVYRGECGDGLSQQQFDAWVNQLVRDTQVIIVEVCENFASDSKMENVTLKIENYAEKNLMDILKEYEEAFRTAVQTDLQSAKASALKGGVDE